MAYLIRPFKNEALRDKRKTLSSFSLPFFCYGQIWCCCCMFLTCCCISFHPNGLPHVLLISQQSWTCFHSVVLTWRTASHTQTQVGQEEGGLQEDRSVWEEEGGWEMSIWTIRICPRKTLSSSLYSSESQDVSQVGSSFGVDRDQEKCVCVCVS